MDKIEFDWNPAKAKVNFEKHHVSFEEAATVFGDEFAILFDDPEHSETEERSIILGFGENAKMLIVCHCLIGDEDIIRIISARKATKSEEKMYAEFNIGW